MTKNLTLLLLVCFGLNISIAQNFKSAPHINVEVYDSSYPLENLAATFTTFNALPNFGLPSYHYSSFGAFRLQDGKPLFQYLVTDTTIGGNNLSSAQAFNYYADGSFSVWILGTYYNGYYLLDNDLNANFNFYDLGIFPDPHGIGKLSDGRFAYFQDTFEVVNFYSPFILDSTDWDAAGHNVVIFDPSDSTKRILFDWYSKMSPSMIVPEYLYEGDQGEDAIDWGHPNSVFEDYDGHLLVSWRHLGICKIDINNGDVIWWAGLPDSLASINGFNELKCMSGDCQLKLQHDLKPIKGKPGQYSLFDNGTRERPESRAVFLQIDEQTNTIEVINDLYFQPSDFMGSVDVLDNGSFLVNVPSFSRLPNDSIIDAWDYDGVFMDSFSKYLPFIGSDLFLYDSNNNLVAKFWTDSANFIYNSFFFDYSDWPDIECDSNFIKPSRNISTEWFTSNDSFVSDENEIAADGKSYYYTFDQGMTKAWSKTIYNSTSCMTTNINDVSNQNHINIFPNPSSSILNIYGSFEYYQVIDLSGKRILEGNSNDIKISDLSNGVYFINVYSGDMNNVFKFIKQ